MLIFLAGVAADFFRGALVFTFASGVILQLSEKILQLPAPAFWSAGTDSDLQHWPLDFLVQTLQSSITDSSAF